MTQGISLTIIVIIVRLILNWSLWTARNAFPLQASPKPHWSMPSAPAVIYWPAPRNPSVNNVAQYLGG